ncbi:helix-turn-helix domain-containing protein [Deminuibacter soli]|nr:helix-turn-helix domain-containing protein [Deminuibacter soli]
MHTANTTAILPSPALAPYIRCFLLRELDTAGENVWMPCYARHEWFMPFCLQSRYKAFTRPGHNSTAAGDVTQPALALGISTGFAGSVCHNGQYRIFSIQFKPAGFYRIFGIPAAAFTDRFFDLPSIAGPYASLLLQQLQEAASLAAMKQHAETFLQYFLRRSKWRDPHNSIQQLAATLHNSAEVPITQLAAQANLSQRTFQRRFTEQVGVSPKTFARIARFNRAMQLKLEQPENNWTHIAHTCGYYDQMHMIKDFRDFTTLTPTELSDLTPAQAEYHQYSSAITSLIITGNPLY